MTRIVHLSLKVDDVQTTGDFYRTMFNFRDIATKKTRDHVSRHMTDGAMDFTVMAYDKGTTSAESTAAGLAPCIHHFAIEVEDLEQSTAAIIAAGCEIVSDAGVIPVKFRALGGTVAELVPMGRYSFESGGEKIDRITHVSLKVDDVASFGDFYKRVFGFKDTETK